MTGTASSSRRVLRFRGTGMSDGGMENRSICVAGIFIVFVDPFVSIPYKVLPRTRPTQSRRMARTFSRTRCTVRHERSTSDAHALSSHSAGGHSEALWECASANHEGAHARSNGRRAKRRTTIASFIAELTSLPKGGKEHTVGNATKLMGNILFFLPTTQTHMPTRRKSRSFPSPQSRRQSKGPRRSSGKARTNRRSPKRRTNSGTNGGITRNKTYRAIQEVLGDQDLMNKFRPVKDVFHDETGDVTLSVTYNSATPTNYTMSIQTSSEAKLINRIEMWERLENKPLTVGFYVENVFDIIEQVSRLKGDTTFSHIPQILHTERNLLAPLMLEYMKGTGTRTLYQLLTAANAGVANVQHVTTPPPISNWSQIFDTLPEGFTADVWYTHDNKTVFMWHETESMAFLRSPYIRSDVAMCVLSLYLESYSFMGSIQKITVKKSTKATEHDLHMASFVGPS